MTKEQVLSDIQQIFRKVFKNQKLEVNYSTNMDEMDDWDSLNHVILIDAIEKHFTIQFNLQDLLKINNVEAICITTLRKLEK